MTDRELLELAATQMTPEEEVAMIESIPGGPYYMGEHTSAKCIERYGRMPKNFKTYPPFPTHTPTEKEQSPSPRGAQWKRAAQQLSRP